MPHDKKGPKELQLQAMREARVAKNKKVIDKNVRAINKVFDVRDQPHQSKTRGKKTVVVFTKVKRGRTGR